MEPSHAEKKLQLLDEIDGFRDGSETPGDLLEGIIDVLAHRFDAEVCLLFGPPPTFGPTPTLARAELKAYRYRGADSGVAPPKAVIDLGRACLNGSEIEVRDAPELEGLLSSGGLPHLAIVPIVMGGNDRVGTLLLIRPAPPFSHTEVDLLEFVETQLDSALAQARRMQDLELRNRELEAIYRVDRIRDAPLDFDQMLDRVLVELKTIIPSELAFILLYDRTGKRLELRGANPKGLGDNGVLTERVESAARDAVEYADLVVREERAGSPEPIMCVPLILREEILGVFGVVAEPNGTFGEVEQRLLRAIASQMDTAIFENLERGRLRQVLERTVDPQVMQRLLEASDVGILEGERKVLTVLYGDLRGSTHLAETADPKHLVEFLNDYLAQMAEVILGHGGTLDKFMGDEVMALFGAPLPMEDHATRAVQVGLEMQAVHGDIMGKWSGWGLEAPPLGVGIATGEMIVGELGSGRRSDYTVLGAPANLGSRIQGAARAGQVLVSPATNDLLDETVETRALPPMRFKGITDEVTVYEVIGFR